MVTVVYDKIQSSNLNRQADDKESLYRNTDVLMRLSVQYFIIFPRLQTELRWEHLTCFQNKSSSQNKAPSYLWFVSYRSQADQRICLKWKLNLNTTAADSRWVNFNQICCCDLCVSGVWRAPLFDTLKIWLSFNLVRHYNNKCKI